MSICVIISNPINEDEKHTYIPIVTESVFENYWLPVIEKLDLKWVRCFQCGIEIERKELELVKEELTKMYNWIIEHMNNKQREFMMDRIDNLCVEMSRIFMTGRKDIKLYIG